MMETFDWSAFHNAQGLERAKMARELAVEAAYLARVSYRSELRTAYLRLNRELNGIADEIEQATIPAQKSL
jgi:hypothetical protein